LGGIRYLQQAKEHATDQVEANVFFLGAKRSVVAKLLSQEKRSPSLKVIR
jgi:hypothetical protein